MMPRTRKMVQRFMGLHCPRTVVAKPDALRLGRVSGRFALLLDRGRGGGRRLNGRGARSGDGGRGDRAVGGAVVLLRRARRGRRRGAGRGGGPLRGCTRSSGGSGKSSASRPSIAAVMYCCQIWAGRARRRCTSSIGAGLRVAHPHDRRVAGDVAGEPGVDVPLGRARLAGRGPADVGGGACARLDHAAQGVGDGARDVGLDGRRLGLGPVGLPHARCRRGPRSGRWRRARTACRRRRRSGRRWRGRAG